MPKTLNSLMKHLRNTGVNIGGSTQKRRLKNIGYYHGYKGYRFAGKASNKLPVSDFSQIAALYDFDTELKSLFYSRIMSIETSLKNYTLEAVIRDSDSALFEDIWKQSLTGYRNHQSGTRAYKEAWAKRQRLRGEINEIIYHRRDLDVIGHFRDADKDIPIWAIFEVLTLGNFGTFYECLSDRVKSEIVKELQLPANLVPETRIKEIIYALKDLRNAIAHNGVIFDVRFKSGAIKTELTQLIKQETTVKGVDFGDITDYVVLLVYMMSKTGATKTECKQLISGYKAIIERYRSLLPFNIYSMIIRTDASNKLKGLKRYIAQM